MEYQILQSYVREVLQRAVSAKMNLGWTPHGGVSSLEGRYLQAMIKSPRKKKKKKKQRHAW